MRWVLIISAMFEMVVGLLSPAQAGPCGMPDVVSEGNNKSDLLFDRFVRKRNLLRSPRFEPPKDFALASQFGAVGDGIADDSDKLQHALDKARLVWLSAGKVYRISKRLELRDGQHLASNGTATVLMDRSGFSNTVAVRGDGRIYSSTGTGILVQGTGVTLKDFFLVKEYEDDRYVIGIDVRSADKVVIDRLRLRGFSLAPGIITIRSSKEVVVSNSIIHASCTQSTRVPDPPHVPSFQITGISIDDTRVDGRGSERIRIINNVITDLFMRPVSSRGEQTDGINFAAIRTGRGSIIEHNYVNCVAEGIDLYGASIEVRRNAIGGREQAIKLIHGAQQIKIFENEIVGGLSIAGIGIWRGGEEKRQVHDIKISGNIIDVRDTDKAAIVVDRRGPFPPMGIVIEKNRILVEKCDRPDVYCTASQCIQIGNEKLHQGAFSCR
jgi:hypothetical protein